MIYLAEGSPFGRSSSESGGPAFTPSGGSPWKNASPRPSSTTSMPSQISADGAKVLYARKGSMDHRSGRRSEARQRQPRQAAEPRAAWRPPSIRARSGGRCTTRPGASSATFSTTPTRTAFRIPKIEARYKPYLDGLASRAEFTYLSIEMLGEITIGHMFVGGPRSPR